MGKLSKFLKKGAAAASLENILKDKLVLSTELMTLATVKSF